MLRPHVVLADFPSVIYLCDVIMLLFSSQIITDGTSIAYGIGQWLTIDRDVYNNSMTRTNESSFWVA